MNIVELGHTGVYVFDLAVMEEFYTRVMGLTVTDRDEDLGIVFLSARPEVEHHELVLQRGRSAGADARLVHQISWRTDSLESLVAFHRHFRANDVKVQQEVSHGNAIGIYFYDPEGNRNEVYLAIDRDVRQPFRKDINLDQPIADIWRDAEELLNDTGPSSQPAN
jgi:catechol-2,3-dioxygenase